MPSVEALLDWGTVATIAIAMTIFLVLIVAKLRRNGTVRHDFALLVWAFMLGWLGAEVLELLSPSSLEAWVEAFHLSVILAFTAFLAFRWSWAMRRAVQGGGG